MRVNPFFTVKYTSIYLKIVPITFRQYTLDAVSYCGSSSCINAVKRATMEGEVSSDRANMFLQSIAFVAQTTDGIIGDVLQLAEHGVQNGRPSRQAFLTLGTLISRHCAKSNDNCVSVIICSPVILENKKSCII